MYEGSTKTYISYLPVHYSVFKGLYSDRPIDSASGVLTVFVIKVHIQAPQRVVDYLLGKPTRASRKNNIKSRALLSANMTAPEAA